jgi:RNA polymerase sigma-70 factor (ECF subfamily)
MEPSGAQRVCFDEEGVFCWSSNVVWSVDSVRDPKAVLPLKGVSTPMPGAETGPAVVNSAPAVAMPDPLVAEPLDVRAVFEAHFEFVWRSLRRLGVRESDVDDAVQEVFVVVHRKRDEFQGRSRLSTWLYGICLRVASDHQRRAYVRREQPTDEPPEPAVSVDGAFDPELRAHGAEARALLDEALEGLDLDKRAVFVLYEIDELSVDEIASRVGVPVGTVYSRLKAARAAFEKSVTRIRARLAHRAARRPR